MSDVSTHAVEFLRASLFGIFRVTTRAGGEIAISNRRARALLAMLCLSPGDALDRDFVSRLLWPGRFQPQARASLRQTLMILDRTLIPVVGKVLITTHASIAIDPECVGSDLADLAAALADRRVGPACDALATIGGRPLLEQIALGAPFERWLDARRAQEERRLQRAVDAALLAIDDPALRDRLARAWRARDHVVGPDRRLRIAILPFAQHDAILGDSFVADGVVEELTFRLGGVAALALVGHTSVASVADRGGTLLDIAATLGVSQLIEGDVYRSTEGIRVTVRLIDGASGTGIWSDRYDGTIADAIGSRQAIGSHFMVRLCAVLGVEAPPAPVRRMTADRNAYALYLQGRALTMKTVGDDVIAKAIDRLEQALRIDPGFAECWTALAEAHLYVATFTPTLDRLGRAEEMARCARRAIALDPSAGYARSLLGVYEFAKHNAVGGLDLAYEAYRLAPDNSEVAVRLGTFLLFLGRPRAALPYIEAAIDRDPVHGRNYHALCAAYLCLGDIDRAIVAGRSAADLGFPPALLAVAYAANGEHERAVDTHYGLRMLLGSMIMRPPGMPAIDDAARDAYFMIGAKGVCSGDPAARALYCQVLDGLHRTMADPYDISIAYPAIYMGHAELVMKIYAEQANLSNVFGLMTLWADIDPVRRIVEHPDFMGFAEHVGFVAAWEKYGWPDRMPAPPGRTLAAALSPVGAS